MCSIVSRVGPLNKSRPLGDCYEKDHSMCPEPCGFLGSCRWDPVCIPRYGVLQDPHQELLQKPGYAILPINPTERVFPFWATRRTIPRLPSSALTPVCLQSRHSAPDS